LCNSPNQVFENVSVENPVALRKAKAASFFTDGRLKTGGRNRVILALLGRFGQFNVYEALCTSPKPVLKHVSVENPVAQGKANTNLRPGSEAECPQGEDQILAFRGATLGAPN
jgi:hypothetical protein